MGRQGSSTSSALLEAISQPEPDGSGNLLTEPSAAHQQRRLVGWGGVCNLKHVKCGVMVGGGVGGFNVHIMSVRLVKHRSGNVVCSHI